MEKMTAAKAAELSGAVLAHGPAENIICRVERISQNADSESIFIALIGKKYDGNDFVEEAYANGCRAFLVSSEKALKALSVHEDAAVLRAENTHEALYRMAENYLAQFDVKKIAVTGSAGKTTTKDMLKCIFSSKYNTVANYKNFNNDIGVSLTAFEVDSSTEVAIFEMGMNHKDEIHLLARIVRPDIAGITNIGNAHIGNLGSRENIMKAKMEITDYMDGNNTLVFNIDNDMLAELDGMETPYKKLAAGYNAEQDGLIMVVMGYSEEGIVESSPGASGEEGISFLLRYDGENMLFYLPVPGIYNANNAAVAVGCALTAGMELADCADALMSLKLSDNRMSNMRSGVLRILDDTYNANPEAMKAALDVLASTYGIRRVAALADMGELGSESERCHREIGEYAVKKKVDVLVAVGSDAAWMADAAEKAGGDSIRVYHFADHEEFEQHMAEIIEKEDVILVKGSHSTQMVSVVDHLKKLGAELDRKEQGNE